MTWNQQWAVKVRYRSSTGGLLGMEMPQMPDMADDSAPRRPGQRPAPGQQPPRKPSAADVQKGLGGFGIPRF